MLGMLSLPAKVDAAGPVERFLQVHIHPKDPNQLVVRYGAASEGLLFSSDAGRTFRAMCSTAISSELDRLSRSGNIYSANLVMDGAGKLLFFSIRSTYGGDPTGCTWAKQPELEGKWVTGMRPDPLVEGESLAVVVTFVDPKGGGEAMADVMRRSADGSWSVVAPLRPHVTGQQVIPGGLLITRTTSGTRLYTKVNFAANASAAPQFSTMASDDGGKTWRQQGVLPMAQERLELVAVDPLVPDRLLAMLPNTDDPDVLFVSEDAGKTFREYAKPYDFSGVTFDPAGRVFIGDAGDGTGSSDGDARGGIWTAGKLGEPLTRVPDPADMTGAVDCVTYDAQTQKLYACKLNRFGRVDPLTGAFDLLTHLDRTESLIECPGKDMVATCEPQLNAGSSWCCYGHYPFTPLCGEYDVTMAEGKRVSCGLSGRAAEEAVRARDAGTTGADASMSDGSGPTIVAPGSGSTVDAAAPPPPKRDASAALPGEAADDEPTPARRKSSGGCSVEPNPTTSPVLLWLSVLLSACGYRLLRRKSLHASIAEPRRHGGARSNS